MRLFLLSAVAVALARFVPRGTALWTANVFAALARRLAKDVPDPLVRQRLAQLAIDVEVLRLTAYRNITQIMRSGQPVVGKEEKESWPNREDQWVLTTKVPLRDPSGNVAGTFGIAFSAP